MDMDPMDMDTTDFDDIHWALLILRLARLQVVADRKYVTLQLKMRLTESLILLREERRRQRQRLALGVTLLILPDADEVILGPPKRAKRRPFRFLARRRSRPAASIPPTPTPDPEDVKVESYWERFSGTWVRNSVPPGAQLYHRLAQIFRHLCPIPCHGFTLLVSYLDGCYRCQCNHVLNLQHFA